MSDAEWIEPEPLQDDEETQIDEYDLTSSPNDFNVTTIYNFVHSGAVKIPGFQRNYVWDIKRASKLIESLIIGLPVPQVFLYEEARNSFLVVDGQQRLMTIYYFVRQRFPRRDKRVEIRRIFEQQGGIPDDVLYDDSYFENFNLRMAPVRDGVPNKFHRLNYSTLGDYRTQFDLRTIRNVIVKQVKPSGDDSSIFEMFNRLNTGGINLTPQEIRSSLYHSPFYDLLFRFNLDPRWRSLLGTSEPDLHMRDIEVLLRAVAMWRKGAEYSPSMVKFLNNFSKEAQQYGNPEIDQVEHKLEWFLNAAGPILGAGAFLTRNGRFSVPLFEAIFAASAHYGDRHPTWDLPKDYVANVAADKQYLESSAEGNTHTANVKMRLAAAVRLLKDE